MLTLKNIITVFTLLTALAMNMTALAAASDKYFCGRRLEGYDKGEFVVLKGDDVNLRAAAGNGRVLKVLPHHSLLRILDSEGNWLRVDSDGAEGYVYAPLTGAGLQEELTQEDFALGYAALNEKYDDALAQEHLGRLQDDTYDKKTKRYIYTYKGIKLGVGRRNKTVESMELTDARFITMRGISVGDSGGRVVGQYGVPDAVSYDDNHTIYEYYFQEEDGPKQYFCFRVLINKKNSVQAIGLERYKGRLKV